MVQPRTDLCHPWVVTRARAEAYDGIVIPFLGFLLMPYTTLVYAFVTPGGVGGLDIVWLVIAVIADLGAWGGGEGARRRRY
ncbi:MAG: hypothetical protein Kow0067_03260 [Coriobacteriia bacterium]